MFVNELNCTVTFQNGATFIAPPRFNAGRQGENLATKVVMRLKNIGLKENKNFTLGYHFEIVDGLGVKYCSPHYGLYCPNGGSDDEIIDFEIPKSITKAGGVATLYAYIGISDDERELITPGLELDFSDVETEKIQVSQNEENQYRGLNALLQQAKTYTEETENNLKGSTEALAEIKSVVEQSTELLENTKETVNGKADKADTLLGYGITDAYTKEETDNKFANAILDYITYEIAGNEVTITGCDTSISGAHIIPDIIEGYPVTKIADSAFRSCQNITSITIPNSVSSIGNSAFWSCSGITSIVLPTKIDSLCDYAFGYCTKLAFVVIPSEINSIAEAAFGGCPSLEHVYYGGTPESWESLMTGLHPYLDDVIIHFANMYETYSKGETDQALSGKADKNKILDYITYQIVNGSVTITDCDTSISGTHIIPEIIEGYPVTVIGNSAFSKCSGLVSITIPNSVIDIGDSAFNGCTALESLVIPDGITIIKADSIPGKYLKKLYLPDSILTIEEGIFPDVGEEHSIEVYYNGTRDQWLKVQMTGFANEGYGSYVTLHCKYDDVPFKPKRLSFADGDTITLANNTTYYANSEISSLTVIYPKTNFICSLEFTLATEGDVTITLPQSRYIGGAPTFANGEAWELNIKNGVVVGGLVE